MKYRVITDGGRFFPQKRCLWWWRFFYGMHPNPISFPTSAMACEFVSLRKGPAWRLVAEMF